MSLAAPAAVATRDVDARVSYWAVVGAQLRKNGVAMAATRLIVVLIASAVVAPVLAFNVPLLWADGGRLQVPLFESLFDRFLFPSGVDQFFNLWLLAGPVWILASRLGSAIRERRRTALLVLGALLAVVLAVEILAVLGGRGAVTAAFLLAVLPGGVLFLWNSLSSTRSPRRGRRVLMLGLACWLTAFVWILFGLSDTRSWKEWHALAQSADAPAGLVAVFPPAPYHPSNVGESQLLASARVLERPSAAHWLGCDATGQDVFTRLLFGTRISLTIGLVAVAIYIAIGTFLGGLAGYYGGKVDLAVSRLVEVMICFPTLFLILTIIAVFDTRSIFLIMAAIGLVGWPGVTRLVRGEFLRQRGLDYVTAAQAQGIPVRRIIFGHILPNCMGPVLVSATFGVAGAILVESSLAFLGLGDKSAPSWGEMLTNGRESLQWHLILAPGIAIFFVVTVFNLLGEGLRDALDPKLRR